VFAVSDCCDQQQHLYAGDYVDDSRNISNNNTGTAAAAVTIAATLSRPDGSIGM